MNNSIQIPNQSRLPLRMALDIVMQGFRIRFGRSLITVFGVFLGIMFLIASAASFIVKDGVKEEDRLRTEAARMWNSLAVEVGSLDGHAVGLYQTGPLNELERRLLIRLAAENPSAILWAPVGFGAPDAAPPPLTPLKHSTLNDIVAGSKCLIIAGGKPAPQAALDYLHSAGYAQPIAVTSGHIAPDSPAAAGLYLVSISGDPTPEEITRQQAEAHMARSRLVWILVISLLVTIISICNAMLMSVVERFREIGTMKCLGADSRFVRRLFLIESSFIGVCGGVGGAVAGIVFAILYHGFVYGFPLVMPSLNVMALTICLLIGILAGMILSVLAALYPAGIASGMVPANALRYDV